MNNTISVYELLGLIKDGKAPKKIKFDDTEYKYGNGYYYHCVLTDIEKGFVEYWLIGNYNQDLQSILNEKVEILEEDKPIIEKLRIARNDITYDDGSMRDDELADSIIEIKDKMNEIIDYINRKEKNEQTKNR